MPAFAAKETVSGGLQGTLIVNFVSLLYISQTGFAFPADGIGIPANPVIGQDDARFAAFKEISDTLEEWMNVSIDPCEDFYGYTCQKGQAAQHPGTILIATLKNFATQLDAYNNDTYFENAPKPLKQYKLLFDKCVNSDASDGDVSAYLKSKMLSLKAQIGVSFPMAFQSENVSSLTADDLANLLGFPLTVLGDGNLVQISVDQDMKIPDQIPARVYVDQLAQMFPAKIYADWASHRTKIEDRIVDNMNQVAAILNVTLDQTKLKADATAVADMEYALRNYVSDEAARRQYERMYNPQTIEDLQSSAPAFNWISLIRIALTRANAPELITNSLQIVNSEPVQITKLSRDILNKKFDPATIANYVYYRAVSFLLDNAPPTMTAQAASAEEDDGVTGRMRRAKRSAESVVPFMTIENILNGDDNNTNSQDDDNSTAAAAIASFFNAFSCYQNLSSIMPFAAGRILIDKVYTTPESRDVIKSQPKLQEIINYVFAAFRTQIAGVNWMSAESKKGALKKIENIIFNIAYPEWIMDDAKLEAYYDGLNITDSSTTIQSSDAISDFVNTQQVENFRLNKPRDRSDFPEDSIVETNAMYASMANSITFPSGFLHRPFYDAQYPGAFNFGAFGYVLGHELTHAFDDEGVQLDYIGALNAWMDASTATAFTEMANCVVAEYGGFCPDNGTCVDGVFTQGENIADNGGIEAAYSAYKTSEAYNGPDPRLPGFGSQFTNDQLFFLSFANFYCETPETDTRDAEDIEDDPHSPAYYRVLGTIQNFPAFRAAFNCPLGSEYAPVAHCDVWSSPPK